jgi:hypothetical protein
MRKVLAVVLAAVLVGMFAYSADAQVPNIQVYFDNPHTQTAVNCPGQVLATLYVVANNFNSFVQAVEYQVNYPSSVLFLNDAYDAPLFVGNSKDGLALSYLVSQNAFAQWRIQTASVFYNCVDCADITYFPGGNPQAIVVDGYLASPDPRYTTPGGVERDVTGMTSLICPGPVANEETSWGQVKSLYSE